jgi:two-component system, cell cycle sensor histidine kinase and response regulator CckA
MNVITGLEILGMVAASLALFVFFRGRRDRLPCGTHLPLAALLALGFGRHALGALEWSGSVLGSAFDPLSDYVEGLWPLAWFLFFFSSLMGSTNRKVRESEERYREFFEGSLLGTYVARPDGNLIAFNEAFARLLGYPDSAAAEGKLRLNDVHFDREELKRILVLLRRDGRLERFETRLRRIDGATTHVILNAVAHRRGNRIVEVRGYAMDVTGQKALEKQLQQALRMEAVGNLAGGIAHNFNNLLTGIRGRTALLLQEAGTEDPLGAHLEVIDEHVDHAVRLTNQLLGFARGGQYEVQPTDLRDIVTKQGRMFGPTRKDISIRETLPPDLWTVEADRSQMEQVLLNLYVNAAQAMPGGGELRVSLSNEELAPPHPRPGRYVRLAIRDSGVGMDEETIRHIFDPFFTTREGGTGTGLGLASVYGVIENHGGFIEVRSRQGRGATFLLHLPAVDRPVVRPPVVDAAPVAGTATGRVLLVDDEEMILMVGQEMLEYLGYEVLAAQGGAEAVEVFRRAGGTVDIAILDLIMPGMGGGETFDRLRTIDPDLKVLLVSGYSLSGEAREIMARGCGGFLQKPFDLSELSSKIEEIRSLETAAAD